MRSILGRFLEHSRVFHFLGGGEPVCLIGSADLMHRNLDRRVEALVRLSDEGHVDWLRTLLEMEADDTTSSWHLEADGSLDPAPSRRRTASRCSTCSSG